MSEEEKGYFRRFFRPHKRGEGMRSTGREEEEYGVIPDLPYPLTCNVCGTGPGPHRHTAL